MPSASLPSFLSLPHPPNKIVKFSLPAKAAIVHFHTASLQAHASPSCPIPCSETHIRPAAAAAVVGLLVLECGEKTEHHLPLPPSLPRVSCTKCRWKVGGGEGARAGREAGEAMWVVGVLPSHVAARRKERREGTK